MTFAVTSSEMFPLCVADIKHHNSYMMDEDCKYI